MGPFLVNVFTVGFGGRTYCIICFCGCCVLDRFVLNTMCFYSRLHKYFVTTGIFAQSTLLKHVFVLFLHILRHDYFENGKQYICSYYD